MNCNICEFVEEADNPVIETGHWITFLANEQAYLGRCYVTLKRHCDDIAKLNNKEWLELLEIIRKLELATKKVFKPSSFN